MQAILDKRFKETGHSNVISLYSFPNRFSKEAAHVEGFCYRMCCSNSLSIKKRWYNKIVVDEDAKLEEELIVRPTSEIIWNTYRGWIESYRDLPILVNQWAGICTMEMRTSSCVLQEFYGRRATYSP
jgi:prolyl-tRNA synthetase